MTTVQHYHEYTTSVLLDLFLAWTALVDMVLNAIHVQITDTHCNLVPCHEYHVHHAYITRLCTCQSAILISL